MVTAHLQSSLLDEMKKFDFPSSSRLLRQSDGVSLLQFNVGLAQLHGASTEDKFERFIGDELNGWNAKKVGYPNALGRIVKFKGDMTVTMTLDDEKTSDFPFEAVERQSMNVLRNQQLSSYVEPYCMRMKWLA